jgi:hypothetical protein
MNNKFLKMAFAGLVLVVSGFVNAGLIMTIQPSADESKTYFIVEWDSLAGTDVTSIINLPTHNPITQISQGSSSALWNLWRNVGDYKTNVSNEFFLRTGSTSYSSNLAGAGLYLDNDSGLEGDDFGLVFDDFIIPPSGSFIIEVSTYTGGFTSLWNLGTYTNNPNVTIVVTKDAFIASAVPEPSTLTIFALGLIGLASRRFKKQS